ncbi:B domain-containing protein [Staphylococcus schleiferi subsp. coagulans]|uniref:B domain-containing protein n=1 Tax=Staphylococcus coagulans TaxID=74706 RepID=UPI0015F805E4|nr:B domain-containing protein [Staphylococcus coagulans]MBA8779852.1 B domain-containing protein [Staphylococcus coagulans]
MKNKYIAKLLMGVATVSIATIVSNGQADASEQEPSKSGLAPAADQTFESAKVSPEQKAFYQVLHMDGITEEQRDQYIKQLHEDKNSAQNVFSESIKDSQRPERRVGQQNAFYEILNNEDITDEQRDRYISEIKENPDAAQKVFVESVNQTETKPAEPQIEPENWEEKWQESDLAKIERKKVNESNEAIRALEKEDTIENRRKAQRAVNKLMGSEHNATREKLQGLIDGYDQKIKADAEARKIAEEKQQPQTEAKPEAPKVEEQKPKVEKQPEVKIQEQGQNQPTPSQPSTPAVPKVEAPSKSTWTDLWNDFKRPFENGYTYIKDSANKVQKYITDSYKSITEKYNSAKNYSKLYFQYKNIIDYAVLGVLNEEGTKAYIAPIEINSNQNPLYRAYAKTSNFVTSSINTGKVLHTLYQNPTTVKNAIKAAETANRVKNIFGGLFSIFK